MLETKKGNYQRFHYQTESFKEQNYYMPKRNNIGIING